MANKIPSLGEFRIPSGLLDKHEWMADSLIDDVPGLICTLIYPDKQEECDNCSLDSVSGRSNSVYKSGGPIPFSHFQICPRCNGEGHLTSPATLTIEARVYWETKSWIDIGIKVAKPDSSAMLIGYMSDLEKLERANKILISNHYYVREGEAVPHGFRRNRYFIQYVTRTNG